MRRTAQALTFAVILAVAGGAWADDTADRIAVAKDALTAASETLKSAQSGRARLSALGKAVAAHEAALAAFAAKAIIEPGKKVNLQYTTTSPVMHERLGVADQEG